MKETQAINDVSWASVQGRSYHLLAVATDAFSKVYEINFKESASGPNTILEVLKVYKINDSPSYAVNWNYCGNILAVAEKKKLFVVRNKARGVWEKIKELVELY